MTALTAPPTSRSAASPLATPERARAPRRRTPHWWRGAAALASWLSVAVVAGLWASQNGVQQLTGGWGDSLTSLGRLTGLVAADLLLVQVLLMARLPWLERAYGQDDLARRHRLVGLASFDLMLVHIATITVGYAVASGTAPPQQLWDLVANYPGMLLATAGTALLVLVVVTSIRVARRRLRYESWHLLHLYAYIGVGLALPHQLWTGADFLASPIATAYWWSLWAAAAGAILVFRVGLPLWRTLRHRVVVEHVVQEAPGVVSVHMSGRGLHALPTRAGQFMVWRFLDGRSGWTRGNPWSLSAAPDGGRLRITVRDLGDGSGRLADLSPGTRVAVEGPFGRLSHDVRTRPGLVLVGAGVGIAPLRALAEELDYEPGRAVLVHRVRSDQEALFSAELDDLAHRRGLRVVHLVGSRSPVPGSWLPAHLAATPPHEALLRLAPDLLDSDVYVCGPDPWTDDVLAAARAAGVADEQLHTERFSW